MYNCYNKFLINSFFHYLAINEVASHLLSQAGAVIYNARNGAEAIKLFEQTSEAYFDIILMDIMMPVMDGLTAAKAIRALQRADAQTIPIFAMTANVFPEDKAKSLAAGMNEHLAKPLELTKLITLIHKYKAK